MLEVLSGFKLQKEAKIGQLPKSILGQLLTFFGVFLISTLLQSAIPFIYIWDEMMAAMNDANINTTDSDAVYDFFMHYGFSDTFLIISLLSTSLGILVTLLYCRGFERRKISSLGFVKKGAVKSYFLGAIIGFLMFALSILICIISQNGTLKIADDISFGIILAYLGGFIVQGMYEEVIFRGYFFVSTASTKPVIYAIFANSVLFSLAHGLNSNVGILAFVNIALFGIFMSLVMMLTDNIWCIGALHSFWNFTQGNFFGVNTSGMAMNSSIFEFSAGNDGEIINGGAFGLEGGLAVTFIVTIAIIVTYILLKRKSTRKPNLSEKSEII